MDSYAFSNVLVYSAQVAIIAALGTALAFVVRMDSARLRYAYWRLLVLLCVSLPWLQGRVPQAVVSTAFETATVVATEPVVGSAVGTSLGIDWQSVLLVILASGIVLRVLWMAVGLVRLRRLRRHGEAGQAPVVEELQAALGVEADVRFVPNLVQPLTFGVRRPVVLLPARLTEQLEKVGIVIREPEDRCPAVRRPLGGAADASKHQLADGAAVLRPGIAAMLEVAGDEGVRGRSVVALRRDRRRSVRDHDLRDRLHLRRRLR